jgi:hypothetical protein
VTGLFTMFTHPLVWLLQTGAFINAALQFLGDLPWIDLLEGWALGAGLLVAAMAVFKLEEIRISDRCLLREAIHQLWIRAVYDTRDRSAHAFGYEHPWEKDEPAKATVEKDVLLAMVAKARSGRNAA